MPKSDVENTAMKVFISYSHKDEKWKDKLRPHLKALEQAGVDMIVWEDRQIDAGEKWHPAIEQAMADAAVSVLLISADYLASNFCIKEEVPYLLNRQEQEGMLLIPVLIRKCPWKAHRWLADRQMLPRDGKCVAIDFPGDLADGVFTDVAERVFDHFARLAAQPQAGAALPKAVHELVSARARAVSDSPVYSGTGGGVASVRAHGVGTFAESPPISKWPEPPADRIDLTRLPETGAALFGRDKELKLLDQAWSSGEKPGEAQTRVLAFVAYGGVGKSTLVNHWLQDMQRDHFRGTTRVFGWSFYSQGAREEGMASADTFIDAALRFFGDRDPASGSAWDKGERLARLAGAERALVVLDGMEPLQSGQTFDKGKLRDPALESLLRGLARGSGGLCLITTREPLTDLAGRPGFASRDLEQISPEAGRALLRTARVVGTDAELEALAGRFGPHALAVSLLGVYLHERDPHHGIGPAKALEQMPGKRPIDRVLAGFEQSLADSAELEVLRILGLFDRPADAGCLGALRAKPPIPGLADRVAESSDADWDRVLGHLERLRLIHVRHKDSRRPVVDAHPLLRERFAQQLREKDPDTWRAAHRRLYEHLCATTKEGDQPTLEAFQPLYQAVAHGCQAGLQQEVCDKVYKHRILRGNDFFSSKKLGAMGSNVGAVACFFELPWRRVSPSLKEADQAWLLNEAAFYLRALGRLTEALEPMRVSGEMDAERKEWDGAARSYSNLSELELTLGLIEPTVVGAVKMAGAVGDGEQSVAYADRSGGAFMREVTRAVSADALHQAGHRAEAGACFRKAEAMQAKDEPAYPLLYSLPGFSCCDLLLATSERAAWRHGLQLKTENRELQTVLEACRSVEQRVAQTLKWVEAARMDILSIALDHLTLGRAALYAAILEHSDFSHIDHAVAGLRRAGQQQYLPLGLLTRAWLRWVEGDADGARADLDEAWEIAERGPMRLFLANIHLYRARLFHAVTPYPWDKDEQGKPRGPKDDLATARKLIEQCGYHRRDEELADAEEAAKSW